MSRSVYIAKARETKEIASRKKPIVARPLLVATQRDSYSRVRQLSPSHPARIALGWARIQFLGYEAIADIGRSAALLGAGAQAFRSDRASAVGVVARAGTTFPAPGSDAHASPQRLRRHRRVRVVSHRSGSQPQGHEARADRQPAIAGRQARMRELPRSGTGARRRRRQGKHHEVQGDETGRGQSHVSDVPRPRHPRRVGGQHARGAQPLLHDLP